MDALNPELGLTLRVADAVNAAVGIRQLELVAPEGGELPPFTAGAHVLVQAPSGATRRYSLCNAPEDRQRYVIAVKREASGRGGSISIVDGVHVGDAMHVSLPRNEFALGHARSHLFIAGGIGITPIRSMVRHLEHARSAPFKLCYLTRAPEVTAFRDEFLAPPYRGKAILHHDAGNPDYAFDLWPLLEKPPQGAHVYCCGPSALMQSVRDMTGHWPTSAVHFEDFAVREAPRSPDDQPVRVRVGLDGDVVEVPARVSILEALRAHGYRIPSSCESGTCGSCRMKVRAGEPDHRDLVLTDAERKREMTVCVSRAHSAELVLEL